MQLLQSDDYLIQFDTFYSNDLENDKTN
ncbi:hypothetical protein PBAL39_03539 [Pedobacter sp. BAL39]|nr:hypothetical protein PBAL39_03539 [Pedobacter sp. BAL39]